VHKGGKPSVGGLSVLRQNMKENGDMERCSHRFKEKAALPKAENGCSRHLTPKIKGRGRLRGAVETEKCREY